MRRSGRSLLSRSSYGLYTSSSLSSLRIASCTSHVYSNDSNLLSSTGTRGYAEAMPNALGALKKPHMNVCTIGHVDHGKTTLTSAVTKYLSAQGKAKFVPFEDIDKAPEEKRRGITINTAHVEYETDKRHYAHIDNPGHKEFVKNMITGTALTDTAILVVDSVTGPMPQTREHILLTRQVGVKTIIMFINKVEILGNLELAKMVELELREMLAQYHFDAEKMPVVYGSALLALNGGDTETLGTSSIKRLLQTMDDLPEPDRPVALPFMMAIEDLHVASGRGAVATGVVTSGKVAVGDPVEIVGFKPDPKPIKAVVSAIETFHRNIKECKSGDSVGILLRGPAKEELRRGMVICKPGSQNPIRKFKSQVYITTKDEGGRQKGFGAGYAPQLYFRTGTVTGSVVMPEGTFVQPGDNAEMEFELIWPCAIHEGMQFSIREGGMTIGAGMITTLIKK